MSVRGAPSPTALSPRAEHPDLLQARPAEACRVASHDGDDASVVDDFIDRIMVDPRLNANQRVDEAHHRVPSPGFKYLVTEMVCWATGGPQKYTGRSMKDSHQHLMITATEWEAFLDDLQQTLDKFAVPQRLGREF
jgi:hemoglobin